jgi:hypothetical protein
VKLRYEIGRRLPRRAAQVGLRVELALMPVRWCLARVVSRLLLTPLVTSRSRAVVLSLTRWMWGNASYSASKELLVAVDTIAPGKRFIVELGAGLTTLVLRRRHGGETNLTTLEHDAAWARRLVRALPSRGADSIRIAPLVEVAEGVDWYQVDPVVVEGADLVICDGPPGHSTRGGRSGMLHLLELVRGPVTLVIDDIDRRDENALLDAVLALPGAHLIEPWSNRSGRFVVVSVPGRGAP